MKSAECECLCPDGSVTGVTIDQRDTGVIYPRVQLLQLRDSPLVSPPPAAVRERLRHYGIQKRSRRRGVRAGRKSTRRIPVIVTDDRQPRCETEIRPESTLVSPLRLSMQQTERALRTAPPPPGERPTRPAQHGISVELCTQRSVDPAKAPRYALLSMYLWPLRRRNRRRIATVMPDSKNLEKD